MNDLSALESLYFAALAQEPEARAAFLDDACRDQPELRAKLEQLLAAHPNVGGFLEQPVPSATASLTPDAATATAPGGVPPADGTASYHGAAEDVGAVVAGKYKLLERIGEGGMGSVFLAAQTEPVKRTVAVKLIKAGMDSKAVLARFEAERQALAMMDHPNIARVLDAGTTDSGRPFFVMELVKGIPITEFCDARKLTPQQRLELFVPVCNAIQHAHQKGVIHRDIKPSNVLVAMYDEKPVPKVIDFGIAKATGQALTDRTLHTGFGGVVGTPEYMSPEQATFNQLDVDTRSDVYALGVLLYELLAGSPPFRRTELEKAGLLEMLRAVREEEPPKPSTKLSTAEALPTLSANRGTEPKRLAALLRGELDWIVMKALEKDRARRYETANGFAADVQRYLSGEPVQAVPPSAGYRLRKAYRRNRSAILGAGAFAAVLLVASGVSVVFAVRATNAEHATAHERDNAARERDNTAEQRDVAEKARKAADDERDKTKVAYTQLEEQQRQQRAEQYSWDMQTLPSVWEVGNVTQVRHLLDRHPPELRGFEWHFWNRQARTELGTYRLPDLPLGGPGRWTFSADGTRVARNVHPVSPLSLSPGPGVTVWDVTTRKKLLTYALSVEKVPKAEGPSGLTSNYVVYPPRISADGKRIALYRDVRPIDPKTGRPNLATPVASHLQVVDVDSGKLLFEHDDRKDDRFKLGAVNSARFSPDGRKVAVEARTGTPGEQKTFRTFVHIWNLDAGGAPVTIESSGSIGSPFSPDGSRIMVRWRNGDEVGMAVHDTATGKELQRWTDAVGFVRTNSPDGTRSAFVDAGPSPNVITSAPQTLRIWDVVAGKELHSLVLPVGRGGFRESDFLGNADLVFSRDGSRLVLSGPSDNGNLLLVVFDPRTGKQLCKATAPAPPSQNLAHYPSPMFSPDGKQLAAATGNIITVWDANTGRELRSLLGHAWPVVAYSFTPDGQIRSLEWNGTLKEWSVGVAEPLVIPSGGGSETNQMVVSADGRWVASGAGNTGRLDPLPDVGGSQIQVREVGGKRSMTLTPRPQGFSRVCILAISADGTRVALLRRSFGDLFKGLVKAPATPQLDDLTVWDVATGKELFYSEVPASDLPSTSGLAISPDGSTVAIGSPQTGGKGDTVIRLFDVGSRREVRSIRGVESLYRMMSFSPDGKRLGALGHPMPPLGPPGPGSPKTAADLPPPKLAVWDVATGGSIFTLDFDLRSVGGALAWSPDAKRVAVLMPVSNTLIGIYDTATGKQVSTIESPNRGATSGGNMRNITFSPDGRRIAGEMPSRSGSPGSVVVVWDANSGKELLTLRPEPGAARPTGSSGSAHVLFTSDGHRLLYFKIVREQGGEKIVVTTWDATPTPPEPKKP